MGQDKAARKSKGAGRDPGGFVALPWSVLDSDAYRNLSANARALLLEVARQFHHDDNGRMILTRDYMATRGWNSSDMLVKAKRELLENKLIFETVKGRRPNKASWYALTWYSLDKIPGFDPNVEVDFKRGAYRDVKPKATGVLSVPLHGTRTYSIAPPHGTEGPSPVPPHGAMRAQNGHCSVPPHGTPLEMPSAGAVVPLLPQGQKQRAARSGARLKVARP
ncbi:hypothetical protein [Piscinibacter koreensis]|uniref:Replication protein n=1 Tax=Piscinibacter koreensis TaxID=2742824 RepID=A0A7Y6NQS5_9BURK|nr:hypothetical protein [Schlegelella koreensis]NUZ07603.1 hypothetical protein [Schlegelella koreensis]